MEEQLERGREEQRRGEVQRKREEQRKRERVWRAQQEREKGWEEKERDVKRWEAWSGRKEEWEKQQKKGPGMILTEEEIRVEVSVKPSIKWVLTDCKMSHFSGMSNKSLRASFQVTLK